MTSVGVPALHTDEDVSPAVAEALRLVGLTVTSVRTEGHLGRKDDQHLLVAHQLGRVFVTHNRTDFELLHDAWTHWGAAPSFTIPAHAGVLIVRRAEPRSVANQIASFLATGPALINQAYSWTPKEGWQRRANHEWMPYP